MFAFQPDQRSHDVISGVRSERVARGWPARDADGMMTRFRTALLGLALAMAASAAAAHDYIVVGSSDPAIAKGQAYDGGVRLALSAGRTLTLMHASGDVITLKGSANGVVLPGPKANAADAGRLDILRVIIAPPTNHAEGSVHLARARGGVCPAAETLKSLDDIAAAQQGGCGDEAAHAFAAWLKSKT